MIYSKILLITIIMNLPSLVLAQMKTQIGVNGIQMWSSHRKLVSPIGYGFFLSQDVSSKIRLRIEYAYHSESQGYVGTAYLFLPPTEDAEVRDFFDSHAWVQTFELALLHSIVRCEQMRLSIGGGLIHRRFRADIIGRTSGFKFPGTKADKIGISMNIDLDIGQIRRLPITAHLGFRQSFTSPEQALCTDSYAIFFDGIRSSEVLFGLSYTISAH